MAKITLTNAGSCVHPVITSAQYVATPTTPPVPTLVVNFAPNSFNGDSIINVLYSNTGGTSWTLLLLTNITSANYAYVVCSNLPSDLTVNSLVQVHAISNGGCPIGVSNYVNPTF